MKVEINEQYEILDQIGRGSYASVHKAIDKKTGEICAIKKISSNTSNLKNLITEIGIMSNCKCDNIVRFLASGCADQEVLIVMEYCCGGSVKDVMRQLRRTLDVDQITVIIRDALNGLEYLHANNRVHRDVKAANILLNEDGVAKLADFGVSEPLDSATKKKNIIGTPLWLPPEVLNKGNLNTLIDIWSLGITIIEMGDGQPPFSEMKQDAAMDEIANLEKYPPNFRDPTKWPQDLLDFVRMCLHKDATKRKNASQLLEFDIMRKAPSNDIIKKLVQESCTTTVNQTESSLFKRYKSTLMEHRCLLNIYEERRMKVIKFDQMINLHKELKEDFLRLREISTTKYSQIVEIRGRLGSLKNEIQELEKERSLFSASLDEKIKRKTEIEDQLNKIKEKYDEESRRRAKLLALAG